jgi:hypothetical protein
MLGLHTFVNERSLPSNPGTGNKIAADKQVGNRAHKLGRYLGGHTATQGIGVPLANNLYCTRHPCYIPTPLKFPLLEVTPLPY